MNLVLDDLTAASPEACSSCSLENYLTLPDHTMDQRIAIARAKLGATTILLGHHYQRDEVIRFADFTGDSYKLSRIASETHADYIVFCGVHFMAEGADILGRDGQQVIILNPTTPIGSGDIKPTPTGRIVVDFLKRKFPAYMDTGLNLVDVIEVARTHVHALEAGRSGERYILGGENLTLKQLLDKMSAITGLPSPTMRVPHSVAMAFALCDQTVTGRLRRKEPRATVEAVRMGKKKMFVSSAKAERELGFHVVPVYAALRSAIDWFRANGYAPAA